ncbi:LOW QUALITY PROTEIN: hypothetical protein CsSME_00020107 [Camellia sinensis var. sinensis]
MAVGWPSLFFSFAFPPFSSLLGVLRCCGLFVLVCFNLAAVAVSAGASRYFTRALLASWSLRGAIQFCPVVTRALLLEWSVLGRCADPRRVIEDLLVLVLGSGYWVRERRGPDVAEEVKAWGLGVSKKKIWWEMLCGQWVLQPGCSSVGSGCCSRRWFLESSRQRRGLLVEWAWAAARRGWLKLQRSGLGRGIGVVPGLVNLV